LAIGQLKFEKAAGEDEIRPEMLKALNSEGILWLTRVCQVTWKFGKTPKKMADRSDHLNIQKRCRKQSTNYRGISLLSLPRKVNAKCLGKEMP